MNAAKVQSLVFMGVDGVAKMVPVLEPWVAIAEGIVKDLEAAGVIALPVPPGVVEKMRQLTAGIEAAQASAVTSALAHQRQGLQRICSPCAEAFTALSGTTDR